MKKIDYYSQLLPMGDLLREQGVQLSEDARNNLLRDVKNSLIQGECPLREFNLGDWILILKGADEYAYLLENMPKN